MFEDRDSPIRFTALRRGFSVTGSTLPDTAHDLDVDLMVGPLVAAMADGDGVLAHIARFALLCSLSDPPQITYRQEALEDFVAHPELARRIYALALQALATEADTYRTSEDRPRGMLRWAVEVLDLLTGYLRQLRAIADQYAPVVASPALSAFFARVRTELCEQYLGALGKQLDELQLADGTFMSAHLGPRNRGTDYVLRRPKPADPGWRARFGLRPRSTLSFDLSPRDQAGSTVLGDIVDQAVGPVASTTTLSAEHVLGFFGALAAEAGFYVGCLNLADQLTSGGYHLCMPVPLPSDHFALSYRGIYDVALAIGSSSPLVGNTAEADDKALVVITGANSGGKSTLLRSIGLAQLMMQCGMFVGADSYRANVARGVFTHFVRQEDATMTHGKLEEELARMDTIADRLEPGALVLFNESFAATNEREGSEIARQIVQGLVDAGVKVVLVTHQYTLANTLESSALFLRAQRDASGRPTFEIVEGAAMPTSFGGDLFRRLGGWAADSAISAQPRP